MVSQGSEGEVVASQATSCDSSVQSAGTNTGHPPLSPKQSTFTNLPNELLIKIFGYLDVAPRSSSDEILHLEPTFSLTVAEETPLKQVSLVSRRWRDAVRSMLFRHAQIRLPKEKNFPADKYIRDFCDFFQRSKLGLTVTTFTFCCLNDDIPDYNDGTRQFLRGIWGSLFELLDPDHVLIIASIEVLAFLTISEFPYEIAVEDRHFFDAPCHYLRLSKPPKQRSVENVSSDTHVHEISEAVAIESIRDDTTAGFSSRSRTADSVPTTALGAMHVDASDSSATPRWKAADDGLPADSTILFARPWTKILLNEGSFLKVYSQSSFWERITPSILKALLGTSTRPSVMSSTIRDMEYVALFPTETHFSSVMETFPRVDRLYVQFVPRDETLQNSRRMEGIDAEDLWMERNRCYALLMRELFNAPPIGNFKYLQKFESGDAADVDAWKMAVEYVKRAENGWTVAGEGVFERETQDLKPEPEALDEFEGSAL